MSARDPIVALGRELEQLSIIWNRLDVAKLGARKASDHQLYAQLEEQQRATSDRQSMIEHAITALRASSAEGALVQLAVAFGLVNLLAGEADDDNADKVHCDIERILYSVAGVLERVAGTTVEALGQKRMMPRYADPFLLAKRVAA